MSLSKPEKSQLKQLIQTPQFAALDHLIKEMIEKYQDEIGARETEWDTIKITLMNEGRIRGLTELMKEIYLQIQSNE